MIQKTLQKELKELFRDGRVRVTLLLVLLLLGVAVWISSRQYQNINQQYTEAREHERDIWEAQGAKNPHSAAHYGTYAFKPKYPLSLLDQGVDKFAGVSVFLEAHKRNETQFSAAADQTGLSRFGDLTPDFILLFMIPILIILMGYNSFTKEKELGTIALLRSQGAVARKIVTGKWLALFLPVLLLVILFFGTAAIVLTNIRDFGVFSMSSLIVMALVYLLYYIIFINLVLFVSYVFKRSGIALVTSLAIWILTCFAMPKAASNFAEAKYPYPTRQQFATNVAEDKKQGLDGHNPWSKEAKLLQKKVLKEYKVDSLHQLPFNFDAYRMQKGEEHEAEIYFKHYTHLKEQFGKQKQTYRTLSVLSPFLPVRFLSMSIAKTDYQTHWDFADAAERYRIDTQKFLNDNFAQNSSYGEWSYRATADTWKKLPEFEYKPTALGTTLAQNTPNIIILGSWTALTFLLLFFTAKKL